MSRLWFQPSIEIDETAEPKLDNHVYKNTNIIM